MENADLSSIHLSSIHRAHFTVGTNSTSILTNSTNSFYEWNKVVESAGIVGTGGVPAADAATHIILHSTRRSPLLGYLGVEGYKCQPNTAATSMQDTFHSWSVPSLVLFFFIFTFSFKKLAGKSRERSNILNACLQHFCSINTFLFICNVHLNLLEKCYFFGTFPI